MINIHAEWENGTSRGGYRNSEGGGGGGVQHEK